ncbi:Fasciclin-2 [Papilio xuthus]|uniref:Fasciclin-2 n=1 Tax=Papilio xuthus TaxID=66420 RepID=A0A194PID6_PAPXU|nr:Fasciclin-2 [Papilio xuthus]
MHPLIRIGHFHFPSFPYKKKGYESCFTEEETEVAKVKSGSSFFQECRCDEPDPKGKHLKWFDINDQEIVTLGPGTKSNIYTEWLDGAFGLYISNVTKSISGEYKCVTIYNGQQYTRTFNVEAYDPPYFVNTAETQYVVNGKDELVICEARGETDPFISWHKNEDGFIEISDDEKYEVISSRGLVIKNVTKEDSGVYKCTASDLETGEGIDRDIKVVVTYMPVINGLIATPQATVVVGGSLTIECAANGMPHPNYLWRKISVLDPADVNVTWHEIANSIVFDSVVADDKGVYECTAFNEGGNATKLISIDVLIPPEIIEFNNVTVIEGQTAEITCRATGRPRPKIIMSFQGEVDDDIKGVSWNELNANDNETVFQVTLSQSLMINQGFYFCIASNDADVTNETMYMSVLHKPYFETLSETLWAWVGKTVNLSCEHKANPSSQIAWRFQGNDVSTTEQVEINKILAEKVKNNPGQFLPLVIDQPVFYGNYECSARNEYGMNTKTITLREGFAPPAIRNVTTVETTPTSATFAIIGPAEVNGPEVIGFTAEYDESNNYDITDIHINRTWSIHRPYKVDKLKPNTTYYIKFAAVNDVGAGQWSETLEFITLETLVPDRPEWATEFEMLLATSDSQRLSWKVPESNGDPIDYYAIRYCSILDHSLDVQGESCKEEIAETNEIELTDLQYNTTYRLELLAHNSQGNSSVSQLLLYVPDGDLSPVLSAGAIIALSVLAVFICLLLLDLLLFVWRKQGIIANCCYKKKNKRKEDTLRSRDKKGLLNNGESSSGDSLRHNSGHKEYEYDKKTGVITGKHSAV